MELKQFTFGSRARSDRAVHFLVIKARAHLARLTVRNPRFHVLHEKKKTKKTKHNKKTQLIVRKKSNILVTGMLVMGKPEDSMQDWLFALLTVRA